MTVDYQQDGDAAKIIYPGHSLLLQDGKIECFGNPLF
jgi:hypothetical protein